MKRARTEHVKVLFVKKEAGEDKEGRHQGNSIGLELERM